MQAIEDAGCCDATKKRVRQLKPGALWHIFDPHDSDKIRDLLNKVSLIVGVAFYNDNTCDYQNADLFLC